MISICYRPGRILTGENLRRAGPRRGASRRGWEAWHVFNEDARIVANLEMLIERTASHVRSAYCSPRGVGVAR